MRRVLDIVGGVAFALFVGILCRETAQVVYRASGWTGAISWQAVWLVAAIVCAPLLPNGIRHDISWRSTIDGMRLEWPELLYATWVFGLYAAYLGTTWIGFGPLGLSLAVGIAEEMLFRVLLLGWLVTRTSVPAALAISSVVFGMAHLRELSLDGILSCAPQTAGGFVLGAVYLRTRNPIAPMIAHAYWDYPYFLALGAGVTGGGTGGGGPSVLDLVPWIGFTIYALWLVRFGVPMVGRVDPVGCACGACHAHRRT